MRLEWGVLQERLLRILERKNHWAWPWFAEGRVPLPRLLPHFQQEWAVYVRDFPQLLARILGHPETPQDARAMLAANIYEEQTGGISGSKSHPELFLKMMEGCGFRRSDFEPVKLFPGARRYRTFLDEVSGGDHWVVGAAVLTIFVEGSVHERRELEKTGPETPAGIEAAIRQHPLVRIHGVDPAFLELQRVHHKVEGGHRFDAWRMVLGNAPVALEDHIVQTVQDALDRWLAYRDDVAQACGIVR
ncbi:MAG TPA: iron-containing redox enzyme family protein [Myxococcales bacterium]|nr:iron-containing redox enzyme family protein [Myxococcales bacterium]